MRYLIAILSSELLEIVPNNILIYHRNSSKVSCIMNILRSYPQPMKLLSVVRHIVICMAKHFVQFAVLYLLYVFCILPLVVLELP